MSEISELFGYSTSLNGNWEEIVNSQRCPFVNKKCYKTRKSDSEISIGTCTVKYQEKDIMICPNRLLERNQIFLDCIDLMPAHITGNELHLLPEIKVTGGNVDYFLVSAKNGIVVDFVGIELQTLDTTGQVWYERQKTLSEFGLSIDVPEAKTFGMNWKMTEKTILVQLHHKISTFESMFKHLVLVVQEPLLSDTERKFNFSAFSDAKSEDSLHIHSYDLVQNEAGYKLQFNRAISTNSAGMELAMSNKEEINTDLESLTNLLQLRLSNDTVLGNILRL